MRLSAATSPPGMFSLMFLTGLSVLSLNMFLPSLPGIAQDLQAGYGLVSLSVAGYLGATAVLQPVVGPLSDRFGRRPVMLACLAIFALASLGCALAPDIGVFLAFRVLQAVIIAGWVLSLTVIRDTSPENEAASRIGYVSMAMAAAPMVGPMLGGVLDQLFGWRSSFVVFASLGALAFVLCWVDLGETNRAPSKTLAAQFRAYPELFRSPRFWGYSTCMAFSTATFYAFLAGAPLVAETAFGLSPAALGFYMGTITAGFALGSFISGRYAKRFRLTTMMIAGRIAACGGLSAGLVLFLGGQVHELSLFGATVFAGLGNGLTLPSANAGVLSVRSGLIGSAAGLSGALTIGGGAVLSSITGAVTTAEHGVYQLLGMMLLCSVVALAAAIYVYRIDRSEADASRREAA